MTVEKDINLKPWNTFGLDAHAASFVTVHSVEEAIELIRTDLFAKQPVLVLGGGSNILFTKNFAGLVVKIAILGKEIIYEDEHEVCLKIGAGESWHAMVMHCVANNFGGIENLSLIPGTMGAAPMQNIGAYGVEIKDVIEYVEALEISTGVIKTFNNDECRFGYRESIFKQEAKDRYIISSVTLRLTKKNHRFNFSYGAISDTMKQLGSDTPSVKSISDAVIHIRQSKLPDPALIGNAGSFFKNPTMALSLYESLKQQYPMIPGYPAGDDKMKVPAGWLIEQCGWKGKTIDNIGVHKHQALVLVNYGGGEGKKIWQLAMDIQASVKQTFNIELHPEVNVV